jgi:hypothetical protein
VRHHDQYIPETHRQTPRRACSAHSIFHLRTKHSPRTTVAHLPCATVSKPVRPSSITSSTLISCELTPYTAKAYLLL